MGSVEEMSGEERPVEHRPLRVATLFSGVGAFEQALKQMGVNHRIVFACDNGERYLKTTQAEIVEATRGYGQKQIEAYVKALYDKTKKPNRVKESYFANYDIDESRWYDDVRFMDGTQFTNKVDILVGGSPCQSFSTYGKKLGLEDTRGTLFYDYARMVRDVNPKVFVFENVKGLLIHDNGKTWETIRAVFEELNYEIGVPQVLNAKDYGLPQSRRRLFVVGIRKDLNRPMFQYPAKIDLGKVTARDYLMPDDKVPLKYFLPVMGFRWTTEKDRNQNKARINRDIIGCQTATQQFNWSGDFRFCPPQPRFDGHPEIHIGEYGGERGAVRKLTPEECFRLMGFENFKIVVDDKTAYRQAGNSIAVPVMKALTREILAQVFPNRDFTAV